MQMIGVQSTDSRVVWADGNVSDGCLMYYPREYTAWANGVQKHVDNPGGEVRYQVRQKACGVCAVRVVVRGAALLLFLWCSPLRCSGAVLCSPCACRAPFPARVPCSAAGYPLFLSWLRCSLPFPLPFSLACCSSLPPLWCLSRSFSLPALRSLSLGLLLWTCEEKGCKRACLNTLLVHATDTVPKRLWNRRFDKVRLRLKRETPHPQVNIKQSILIRLLVPREEFLQPISDLVSHMVSDAPVL